MERMVLPLRAKTDGPDHPNVWELLPWYVNGTLSHAERAQVEAHLKDCVRCRQELERCRQLAVFLKEGTGPDWTASPAHFARMRPSLLSSLLSWLRGVWRETPWPVHWILAVESTAVVLLALVLVLPAIQPSPPPPPTFETLSNPESHAAAAGPQLRVVFKKDATEGEIRALLQAVGGSITAGPTPLDVYTVTLLTGGPQQEAVPPALARLRAHPKVRLVEPVTPQETR